jgi:hypothetical protein
MDSLMPRDVMQINPHFLFSGTIAAGGVDEQNFVNDARDAMVTYGGGNKPTTVKMYDAQGTPPVFPVAQASGGPATAPGSGVPREVALCLSYYSGQNIPRKRGRLYVPAEIVNLNVVTVRPTAPQMTKCGSLAQILADLGGADVDWCVYSRLMDAAYSVSNWWVDDEWDTVRSRGLRSTTRQSGAVNE